jgi:signal peptidase I
MKKEHISSHQYGLYGTGCSMFPTLRVGDSLNVIAYGDKKIYPGDVVLFRGSGHDVVHRVIAVNPDVIITQGDNNAGSDEPILPENILGHVISVQRENLTVTIHGGKKGLLIAKVLRIKKALSLKISRILHPLYHALAGSGIFRITRFETQILCFERPEGTEMQLLLGKRVIAKRHAGSNEWKIRRPFRLFIDETSLP